MKPEAAPENVSPDRLRRAIGIAVAQSVTTRLQKVYEAMGREMPPQVAENYEMEITSVVKQKLEQEITQLDNGELLVLLGLEPTQSNVEQFAVFLAALQIHNERNARYQDVWKESGWKGALFDLRKKASRLFKQFGGEKETEGANEDDAYDLINFTAFFLRARQENNEWGTWR